MAMERCLRTRADAIDVRPTTNPNPHKNLKSSNMYVGHLLVHGVKGSQC